MMADSSIIFDRASRTARWTSVVDGLTVVEFALVAGRVTAPARAAFTVSLVGNQAAVRDARSFVNAILQVSNPIPTNVGFIKVEIERNGDEIDSTVSAGKPPSDTPAVVRAKFRIAARQIDYLHRGALDIPVGAFLEWIRYSWAHSELFANTPL